jgi:hypothetical protein
MHMKILLRCFVILALAVPAGCQDTATFRGNSQHTGVYDTSGPTTFGKVQWKFHSVEGWRAVSRVVNFPRTFYDDATLLFPFRA